MTEDEAKTRWCPFVRIRGNDTAYNRMWDEKLIPPQSHCIASACMAWRWQAEGWQKAEDREGSYWARTQSAHGCCGLAGPQ